MSLSQPYYVGAYWGPRREDSQDCVRRLELFLNSLSKCHPLLRNWRKTASTRQEADTRSPLTTAEIASSLASDRNRREVGGALFEELGYSLRVWTGDGNTMAGLSLTCGAYSPFAINHLVLNLPDPSNSPDGLYSPSTAECVMDAVVDAWEPDWASLTSNGWRTEYSVPAHPFVPGWVTYISDAYGRIHAMGAVRVRKVGAGLMLFASYELAELDVDVLKQLADAFHLPSP